MCRCFREILIYSHQNRKTTVVSPIVVPKYAFQLVSSSRLKSSADQTAWVLRQQSTGAASFGGKPRAYGNKSRGKENQAQDGNGFHRLAVLDGQLAISLGDVAEGLQPLQVSYYAR